jgi:SP family sugar:H+ symporter-like MFS transporter
MKSFKRSRNVDTSNTGTAVRSPVAGDAPAGDADREVPLDLEKPAAPTVAAEAPQVTLRTFTMAILVAMGGFIFGYDTGQISGFLQMSVFLQRFGEPGGPSTPENPGGYQFNNVRAGVIVGLVSRYLPG